MKFELSRDDTHGAKFPHELFLTNMIGNHILWFVAALGMAGSFWQPLVVVPVVSLGINGYTLWRARRSRRHDSWFVCCHWQIAARRSRGFLAMLGMLATVSGLGWLGHHYLAMRDVAVMAFIGGVGLLPVMVSVLALIVMESDALHQATDGRLSRANFARYPNEGVVVLEDDLEPEGEGVADPRS